MKIIVLGDNTEDLSDLGSKFNAKFITYNNLNKFIYENVNGYISLADVKLNDLIPLLDTADKIVLQEKAAWTNNDIKYTSIYICRSYSHKIQVDGLEYYDNLQFHYVDSYDKQQDRTLWLFGGSMVAGHGFNRPESELFGTHLAKYLGINKVINTAKDGAGLRRSLETLTHCDIKPNDFVVLDPTSIYRLRLYKNKKIIESHLSNLDKFAVLSITEDQLFYDFVSQLDTFLKICKLYGAITTFFSYTASSKTTTDIEVNNYFSRYPEWSLKASILLNHPLDILADNMHPGVNTHKELAKILYKHLTNT